MRKDIQHITINGSKEIVNRQPSEFRQNSVKKWVFWIGRDKIKCKLNLIFYFSVAQKTFSGVLLIKEKPSQKFDYTKYSITPIDFHA